MSFAGIPTQEHLNVDASGLTVAVIAGSWHEEVTSGLTKGAMEYIEEASATSRLITVAGSFEIPLAAQAALNAGYDAAVCLGVIVRGDTPHFDFVAGSVTDGLTRVQLDSGKPVGFGILTVETEAQALDRAGLDGSHESKGREAAQAALHLAVTVRNI